MGATFRSWRGFSAGCFRRGPCGCRGRCGEKRRARREAAHGDVLRGPFADAGNLAELLERALDAVAGLEMEVALGDGLRQGDEGARACADDAQLAEFIDGGAGEAGGFGEEVAERGHGDIDAGAESRGDATGHGARGGDSDLLAEDGADGGPRNPSKLPGTRRPGRSFASAPRTLLMAAGVGLKIEEAADFFEHGDADGDEGIGEADGQDAFVGFVRDLEKTGDFLVLAA